MPTRDWLSAFGSGRADDDLPAYAVALAAALTEEWQRLGLVWEIFISGVEHGDLRFWYVRNSQDLHDHDWTFKQSRAEFRAVDDLDPNYIARDLKAGQSPRITPDVVVTVVTAARTPPADWLLEAYDSLRQPAEVSWEWALQIDGTVEDVRAVPPSIRSDPRVRVEPNGRWLGTAATRNRALSRSNGEFVQNLDADDLVLPGALDSAVRALQEEPTAAFAFGRTVHLHEDGRLTHPWETEVAFPPGRIEPGVVSDFWLRHGWDGMPISPVMWRHSHLFAIGGWAALSTLEDKAAVITAAELWPSVYIDLDAQVYRINETQTTASAAFAAERRPNEAFLRERLFALKRLGLRPLPP